MAQYLRYDKDGKEHYFDKAVDAREGVQMGHYFETKPEEEPVVEPEVKILKTTKKEKAVTESEVVIPEPEFTKEDDRVDAE